MAVTDLTGTKWVFNAACISAGATSDFNITYTSSVDNVERTILRSPYIQWNQQLATIVLGNASSGSYISATDVFYASATDGEGWYISNVSPYVKLSTPPTIEITGGTDATNADLIAWLQSNATQIVEPIGNSYELTHSLMNLTHGNITLQITPDAGYAYPSTLTVTNGTLVSYDNTTGVAVISGDDTTVVNGECVEQPSGYSLTFGIEEGQGCDSTDGKCFDVRVLDENDDTIDGFYITPNNPQTIIWPSNAYRIHLTTTKGGVDYFHMWSIDGQYITYLVEEGDQYDFTFIIGAVSLNGNAYIKAVYGSEEPA